MMLSVSTVFSHCFFIAYKDVMKGTEKKKNLSDFSFIAAKIFDKTMIIG